MLNLDLIEHHPQRVLEAFRRGEFDQIEIIGQADEKEFFELCFQEKMLADLAKEMPTPRKKEEVPLWFVLAANLSLKLHVENSFLAFERVVRCGGLLGQGPILHAANTIIGRRANFETWLAPKESCQERALARPPHTAIEHHRPDRLRE